ncbi:HAMP domain-containing sensor histidine kinase [Desmospora profundinema]|uniref:histidine kinase n=1 Tax=Desmospora profundinema TaxID=1571184 RepID=A0ABU1IQN4_9BACL|nr:HAMP domain-containing sensor histidine kinase [Desmospora profundinema]MDR6227016.1 signal transduction histidine kinase/uncharacterized membrane protein YqjE [Desmospora profundinema]
MRRWGMFGAGRFRAGMEGLVPVVLASLAVWLFPPGGLVQLGGLAIGWSLLVLWALVWPAYRIRLPIRYWRAWIGFSWLYLTVIYIVNAAVEWRLVSIHDDFFRSVQHEFVRSPWEYGLYLVTSGGTIALARGVLHVWRRFSHWVERRLIRQMTVSHIQVLGVVFAIFSLLVLAYLLIWDLPDRVKGVKETEEAARWTAPLLSEEENEKRLKEWLEQMEHTLSPSGLLTAEWIVFDQSGRMLGASGEGYSHRTGDMVEGALRSGRSQSTVVEGERALYVVAAPIYDEEFQVTGVLVQERPVEPLESFVVVVLFLSFFMLVSLAVFPVSLGVALLISGVFAYVRSRKMTERFQQVAQAAEEWSRGNLEHRIGPNGRDEVGKLSDQLNQVAVSLAQAQDRLAAEKREVERLLQSKKAWVSDVSHELRTPVALIHGHLEMMDGQQGAVDRERLPIIRREVTRLKQMIDQLFHLAVSDDMPEEEWERQPVAMDQLLREVGEAFSPIAWRERKIAMEWDLPPNLPIVMGDENRIRQILHNLIRNALRHTPEGGMVRLAAMRQSGSRLEVRVSDTGSGIDPEELAHIFQRRFRGDGQIVGDQGGGLGLALVKEWIEQLDGEVTVHSEEGGGTEVVLTFPV